MPGAPNSGPATDFADLGEGTSPSKIDQQVQSLTDQVEGLKLGQREERLGWVIVCIILIDVIWFRNSPNPTFPIAILILQLIALFVLALRLNLPHMTQLFMALVSRIGDSGLR